MPAIPGICPTYTNYTTCLSRLSLFLRHHVGQLPASPALPLHLVRLELIHRILDLRPQIRTMEARLMHHTPAVLTVPSQSIPTVLRPRLLQDDTDGVGESDGVVRRVGGQEEHFALADVDVAELALVDDFQEHGAFVLVEPFGRFVDVVVCSRVGSANDLLRAWFVSYIKQRSDNRGFGQRNSGP